MSECTLRALLGDSKPVVEEIERLESEMGVDQDSAIGAAEQLAMSGFDAGDVAALLGPVVLRSWSWDERPEAVAEAVATLIQLYDIPNDQVDHALDGIDKVATRRPVTAMDVLSILERLGPQLPSGKR